MSAMWDESEPFKTQRHNSKERRRRAYRTFKYITDDYGDAVLLRWCYGPCQRWLTAKHFTNIEKKTGRPKGMCAECKRKYDAVWREQNRERLNASHKRWRAAQLEDPVLREVYLGNERRKYERRNGDEEYRAKRRQWARNYYARLKQDPERYARYLEMRRMATRLRQERLTGQLPVKILPTKFPVKYTREEIDMEPIAQWMARKVIEYGSVHALAVKLGMHDRDINRIQNRTYDSMTFEKVDRILTREGSTQLWELYPDLAEAA